MSVYYCIDEQAEQEEEEQVTTPTTNNCGRRQVMAAMIEFASLILASSSQKLVTFSTYARNKAADDAGESANGTVPFYAQPA